MASCSSDELANDWQHSKNALAVMPYLLEHDSTQSVQIATRAVGDTEKGDGDLGENNLGNTLDVFVQGIDDQSYWKEYHLNQAVADKELHFLAQSWINEGLEIGKHYDIYVACNNRNTNNELGSLEELKSSTTTDNGIYTLKGTEAENTNYASKKTFLVDGYLQKWTPDTKSQTQEFDVELKRAAAKIAVNISLSEKFKTKLNGEGYSVESLKWRYVNFCINVADIAGGNAVEPKLSSGTTLLNPTSSDSEKEEYSILTYTYPFAWGDDVLQKAPYLLVQINYAKSGEKTKTNYYRIPVCNEATVDHLERNNIYHVNAIINSYGSTTELVEDNKVQLQYEVAEWTEENAEIVNVHDLLYLKVVPGSYDLKGEGKQSVSLQYFAPDNKKVLIKKAETTTDEKFEAYYYDKDGKSISHTDGTTVSDPDTKNKTITVTSTALANRAVKYIKFRVYLEGHEEDLHQDIVVKHFPIDNIQNIEGSWSSKYTKVDGTKTAERTSYDPIKDGWGSTNYNYTEEECDPSDDGAYQTTGASDYTEWYYNQNNVTRTLSIIDRKTFLDNVPSNNDRYYADSEYRAYGNNGVYYYATDDDNASEDDYDYYYRDYGRYYYYKYKNYYKVTYTKTVYKRKKYTRTVEEPNIISDWVMWDTDQERHDSRKTTYDTRTYYENGRWHEEEFFHAKTYYNGTCYDIKENHQGYGYYKAVRGTNEDNLTNNHMYVIQIEGTSDKYILGRPHINSSTHLSSDQVVSPAFMIASQLGATYPTTSNSQAAEHCTEYMEVAKDGTKYTGWRLPTEAEIGVIISYQNNNDDVISEVLSGRYYWCLDGKNVTANNNRTDEYIYTRCVRDLSADEVSNINSRNK